MIRDLDDTIQALLTSNAPTGSELSSAAISFELPDAEWRQQIGILTVNCYLYDIRENTVLRTREPLLERSADRTQASRRRPPVRVDCGYCITAWSQALSESVADEHRLLSQVLMVLLQHPTIPASDLRGSLVNQVPPYPTVIALPDGVKNQPEFWGALDQQLKPSLNYVVTLAMMVDEAPAEPGRVIEQVTVETRNRDELSG
jgi:hypothetical protein